MKVFVVDDDELARLLANDALGGLGHEIRELETGSALQAAAEEAPDLILLDIEMPDMDGISACRALRQAGHDHPFIIFISSHDDLENRLAAYDAGGSDFIAKPYDPQELAQKVRIAEVILQQRTQLTAQASYACDTAFTAMASMGEMGNVLHFLRASFSCRTPEQLATAVLHTLQEFGLQGMLDMRLPSGKLCFSSQGECTPLEVSILAHAESMDRIFQFRDRLVLNYPALTLVVHKLPLHEPERVGRQRDHLALLAEGASEKIQAMILEQHRQAQASGIHAAVAELSQTLIAIESNQAETRMRALQIDSDYLEALVSAFVHLGLTDAQENALAGMAERSHLQLTTLLDDDYTISNRLRAVAEQLRQLGTLETGAS